MDCSACEGQGWTEWSRDVWRNGGHDTVDGVEPCGECTLGQLLATFDYECDAELMSRADALRAAVIADIESGAVAVSL